VSLDPSEIQIDLLLKKRLLLLLSILKMVM